MARRWLRSRGPMAALTTAVAVVYLRMVDTALKGPLLGIDFRPVWASAHHFVHHQPIYAGALTDFVFSFYPPSAAVLTAPLGLIGQGAATKLFLVLQSVALVAGIVVFARRFCGERWRLVVLGTLAGCCIVGGPEFALEMSNLTVLMTALAMFVVVGIADDRPWSAPLLGIGLALKPTIWPLLFVFVAYRQSRKALIAGAVAAGAVLVGLAATTDGSRFFTAVLPYIWRGEPDLTGHNVSVVGVVRFLGLPSVCATACEVVIIVLAAALVMRSRRAQLSDLDLIELAWALIFASFVASSWSLWYYAVFGVAPLMLVLDRRSAASLPITWVVVYGFATPLHFGSDKVQNLRIMLAMAAYAAALGVTVWRRLSRQPDRQPVGASSSSSSSAATVCGLPSN